MSSFQRELFRLPYQKPEPVTTAQRKLLTWLVYGKLPVRFRRQVLRELLRKRWVERIGSAPAVFRLTALGQAVRRRGLRVSRETVLESAGDAAV